MSSMGGVKVKKFKESVIKALLPQIILTEAADGIYGYDLIRTVRRRFGIYLGPSTIYPMLSDLESKGFIQGKWEMPNGKPRKVYELTSKGRLLLDQTTKTMVLVNSMIEVKTHG